MSQRVPKTLILISHNSTCSPGEHGGGGKPPQASISSLVKQKTEMESSLITDVSSVLLLKPGFTSLTS